jgi:hypothetical protein
MDFRSDDPQPFDPATGLLLNPSTKVRNEILAEERGASLAVGGCGFSVCADDAQGKVAVVAD